MGRPKSFLAWLKSDTRTKERQEIEQAVREAEELDAVRRMRAGDESGLVVFIEAYGADVYRRCWRILRNERDAEEACADAFRNLWLHFDSWDPTKGSLCAWLLTIAKHCSIDTLRKTRRHGDLLFFGYAEDPDDPLAQYPDTAPSPSTLVEISEFMAMIESTVSRIENLDQRMAFMLRHLEGFSIREVAQALDANPATVRVWLWRATRTMARVLGPRRPRGRAGSSQDGPVAPRVDDVVTPPDDSKSEVVEDDTHATDAASRAEAPALAADGRSEIVAERSGPGANRVDDDTDGNTAAQEPVEPARRSE